MSTAQHSRRDRIQASRQFRDGKFRNTSGVGPDLQGGSTMSVMREFFFGGAKRVPRITIPVESPLTAWATPAPTGLRVTWLGHSSLLLEIDGFRALVDPVFGPRASPVSFAGPKRFHPPPVSVHELPPLDVVLLSHDHHDHLDPRTIRELAGRHTPFVTSLGVGARLEKLGIDPKSITELDWFESVLVPNTELSFTATPAQHFSGRGLGDRNSTLWSSWVIDSANHRLFYTGDTGLTDELADIGKKFGPFGLSILEIGAWHPAWGAIHLGPANALRAFAMLGGGTLLPVHWGTFDLALHAWDEPIEALMRLAPAGVRVLTPPLGRAIEPARVDGPTFWWRDAPRREPVASRWCLPRMSD
jgi:L-ascorbate metabolism protein UlaG (beta-lactamase superfamily)